MTRSPSWFSAARMAPGLALAGLVAGLVVGLAGTLWVAVVSPEVTWVPPALALGTLAAWGLARAFERPLRHPLTTLGAVFFLAAFSLHRSDGLQPLEIVFALYFYPYLAAWYGLRVGVYRERLVRSGLDAAVGVVMLYPLASLVLTVLFRGSLAFAISDLIAFSMFALYFPIREVCERYERGPALIVGALLFIAVVAFVRNLLTLRATIAAATAAWEIARVRITSNEMALMVGALFSAGLAAQAKEKLRIGLFGMSFAALATGLVLTQWRAYYVSFILALGLLAVLLRRGARARLLLMVSLGSVGATALVLLLFGDSVLLVAYGLLDRFLSIGTASTVDVSLLNRFLESRAVLARIWESPLVGHGVGTAFGFHDVTSGGLWIKPYAHNGYLTLVYKYGVLFLFAFLFVWVRVTLSAHRASRAPTLSRSEQTIAAVVCAALLSLVPSFAVSAPLTTSDTTFCFTLLLGLGAGLHARATLGADPERLTRGAP